MCPGRTVPDGGAEMEQWKRALGEWHVAAYQRDNAMAMWRSVSTLRQAGWMKNNPTVAAEFAERILKLEEETRDQ